MATIKLELIVWDPSIYPRSKWNTSTIERYTDALEAGDQFPPLILEEGTNRLLDGKHRFEAYKRAGVGEVAVRWDVVPDGVSAKRYAAKLSARHGDRMSNADLKALAIEDCESDPKAFDVKAFSREMGVGERTVYDWVGHILGREREERKGKALRLSMLGWQGQEIANLFGLDPSTVSLDLKNCETAKTQVRELFSQRIERHEIARRFNLTATVVEAITLDGQDDAARMKRLGINVQPYDVWQFPGCHDLMGDAHPGRIPGELLAHVLYFYTQPGDLIVDPMVGSGTTLDACLLMGRKARGYDIDERHDRIDVEQHDMATGWPNSVKKAALVFWDPPYYSKMDSSTIGADGYIDGSISKLSPDDYLQFFGERFAELSAVVKSGTRLAFLMSDWDPEGSEHDRGLFIWDYADLLRDAGWKLERHIQVPLSTQQVHPDIVNKFRASRRLARLERYLLVGVK